MTTNPYQAIGEQQARKIHERRVATIAREKDQDDTHTQFNAYRKSKRAELTALLSNPYVGDKVAALVGFLKTMGPESAPGLVDYIEHSEWLRNADADTKQTCLGVISSAIIKVRVQQGLAPFDDPMVDEEPNAFQIIYKLLTGV